MYRQLFGRQRLAVMHDPVALTALGRKNRASSNGGATTGMHRLCARGSAQPVKHEQYPGMAYPIGPQVNASGAVSPSQKLRSSRHRHPTAKSTHRRRQLAVESERIGPFTGFSEYRCCPLDLTSCYPGRD
jgi:hypothetical protein